MLVEQRRLLETQQAQLEHQNILIETLKDQAVAQQRINDEIGQRVEILEKTRMKISGKPAVQGTYEIPL